MTAVPIAPPHPPLADGVIRLEPLTQADVEPMLELTQDPDVVRFTRVPDGADRRAR